MRRNPSLALAFVCAALVVTVVLVLGGGERGLSAGPREGEPAPAASLGTPARGSDVDGGASARGVRDSVERPAATSKAAGELDLGAFEETAVYGVVRDGQGRPIANADVLLFEADGVGESARPQERATSGPNGRFRFQGLRARERFSVYAEAQGYLPSSEATVSGHDLEIALESAVSISGRVLAREDRRPLAGVVVFVDLWHWTPEGWAEREETVSAADGTWWLARMGPGEVRSIHARRPGRADVVTEFQVDREHTTGYDIVLAEASAVTLELIDHATGSRLADFAFRFDDRNELVTDALGRASFVLPDGLGSGRRRGLTFQAEGWCSTWVQNLDPLRVGPDVVRVPMLEGARVHGRVVGPDGAPIRGARVFQRDERRGREGLPGLPEGVLLTTPRSRPRSDEAGRFELTGLVPSREPTSIAASHPSYRRSADEQVVLATSGAEEELELTLRQGARLTGTVTIDDQPTATEISWSLADESGWTTSNDRGGYRLEGLPEGLLRLGVRLDRRSWNRGGYEEEDVWIEGEHVEHDLVLYSGRLALAGSVVDELGAPVPGATVTAWARDGEVRFNTSAETDDEGRFELKVEAPQGVLYLLNAREGVRRAFRADVAPGSKGVELVLPAPGKVRLAVLDALSREPLDTFELRWRGGEREEFESLGGWRRRLAPGPDGTFVAELPLGQVDLFVSASEASYRPLLVQGVRVEAEPGPRPVQVLLEHGVHLVVSFDAEEEVQADVYRWLRRRPVLVTDEQIARGEATNETVRTAQRLQQTGRSYQVQGLQAGTYSLLDLPRGLELVPARLEIPHRERHEVRIRVRRAAQGSEGSGGV